MRPHPLLFMLILLILSGCDQGTKTDSADSYSTAKDPLPSWNEGEVKSAILDFVTEAVTEGADGFIPEEDRIATFDNDGTLWAEKPVYFQFIFAIDRVKEMASEHPEWDTTEPFRSILNNDLKKLEQQGLRGIIEVVMATHTGMDTREYAEVVAEWIKTARHPVTEKPFTEMVYQPMLELLDYLRANKFKTFIVSGGGVDFLRVWAEAAYGIPPYQVVGSSVKTKFVDPDGEYVIQRLPEIEFIDDKEGKPVGINRFIGKLPVLAAGNSDGDLQMLQYSTNYSPSLQLYVHHTDSIREWAYDRNSPIGKLDKGLDEATKKSWTVIDMARDWKVIYPWQLDEMVE